MAKLMAKLEAAEKERDELRNEIACVKEVEFPRKAQAVADAWKGKCERLEAERDALRARIEAMERQEPVGVLHVGNYYGEELQDWEFEANQCACDKLNEVYVSNPTSLPLYALHGAQPAPTRPLMGAGSSFRGRRRRQWSKQGLNPVTCSTCIEYWRATTQSTA
jgi:hypothetical protein